MISLSMKEDGDAATKENWTSDLMRGREGFASPEKCQCREIIPRDLHQRFWKQPSSLPQYRYWEDSRNLSAASARAARGAAEGGPGARLINSRDLPASRDSYKAQVVRSAKKMILIDFNDSYEFQRFH